ncbi:MAG: methionyl-tRNA formyltransferase [Pirellulaceae bacterium]
MRLIMMGTGPFAVPTFESLLNSPHRVMALVTRPAVAVQTRGKPKAVPQPMREVAQRHQLLTLAPDDVNASAAQDELRKLDPELLVVCDYGQLLSAETLAIAPLGGINLHGSLLPKYRGAAPVNWAIWQGDTETGVTVLHMTPRLDAGPSLVQASTPIGPDETAQDLEPRLARLGVEPVLTALHMLEAWDRASPLGIVQDRALATKAPRLKKSDGCVDWCQPAAVIYRQFRALQPWPGVYTEWHRPGQPPLRLILLQLRPADGPVAGPPGAVHASEDGTLCVATGNGAMSVSRLQPAGRNAMSAAEFLRGYQPRPGDTWGGAPPVYPKSRLPS